MLKTYSSKLQNYTVYYHTKDEYHHLKREIFTYDTYYFETENAAPLIIDAGAHIGLATLYFKHIYPGSRVIAVEPNPASFEVLEKNIFENQLDGVQAINAALSNQNGKEAFYLDDSANEWWSTAGFIKGAWTGDQDSQEITVPTITLNEIIQEPVDFMKMDIEGAEYQVLSAAKDALPLIRQLYIEYHPHSGQDSRKLIELLEENFKLTFYQEGKEVLPKKVRGLFHIEGINHSATK